MPFIDAPDLPPFLEPRLPYRRRAFELEGGRDAGRRIHFLDHGPRDGRAVFLQHGNPTWSFLWRKVIAELDAEAEGLRLVAPDLLGLGLSSRLPAVADHSLARHADALTALVDALELDRLVLVGQDWGGPMVAAIGARRPERVAGVVLANTSVLRPRRLGGTSFHRLARRPIVSDLLFRVMSFPQRALHRAQADPASISGEVARAYRWPLARFRDRVAPLALARMVPDRPDHPSLPEIDRNEAWLRSFDGPMALVWGEKDPILGRALKSHAEAFPEAFVTRTEAGHFLQEEVPAEVADAIRDVLRRGP